ncbi:non-canonical purine NTP pyrophosphatase, RdgB/HAM1 family [Candidatus Kaiserbacteria bacterium RIFCSPHIGHO2_01_FULL_55_17]|uniref:dITP/XTP pyrophosphatase n=1 Tax=Candidatus Kaiserbacteria bacterium RIFCSPHIGHO2_01_FULL_55_17 TaxID=1798484 RepID=A0A1F6D797_9BACT|nr:MAG: non-canonical purine NTP pyrophosphatase, RdgB/HAM1 family [Candidatus Kaiserbacteria bacterium RIFCSPHIGHO2_01_FULL_55_17]
MRELLIATRNKGKWPEIVAGLTGMPFQLVNLDEVGIPADFEPTETATTFEGNALIKAFLYGKMSGKLTLAEDAGLEVDTLGGRPGVLSARYAPGSDEDRCRKILTELSGINQSQRGAQFRAAIAIYDPEHDDKIRTCEGVCKGHIATEARGSNGFGYDPIFYSDELGKTGGEMTLQEKDRVSHRGRALRKAREILLAEFA